MAQPLRLLVAVRDHDDGGAGGQAFSQHLLDAFRAFLIERTRRLVHQQYRRVERQGADKCHALPLAGGKLDNRGIEQSCCERQPGRHVPGQAQRVAVEMFGDRFAPPTRFGRAVDHAPAPGRCRHRVAFDAIEEHLALVRVEIGDHAQEQTLSSARWAGDGETLAGGECHVERAAQTVAKPDQPEPVHLSARELRQQSDMRADAMVEAALLELLVGAVHLIVVQAEAHQQGVEPENAVQ